MQKYILRATVFDVIRYYLVDALTMNEAVVILTELLKKSGASFHTVKLATLWELGDSVEEIT